LCRGFLGILFINPCRDGNDYLSKNAEQEVSVKLGLDYQKDDTTASTLSL
jgi:hypothetical protein